MPSAWLKLSLKYNSHSIWPFIHSFITSWSLARVYVHLVTSLFDFVCRMKNKSVLTPLTCTADLFFFTDYSQRSGGLSQVPRGPFLSQSSSHLSLSTEQGSPIHGRISSPSSFLTITDRQFILTTSETFDQKIGRLALEKPFAFKKFNLNFP